MGAQGSETYGNAVATDASGNVYAVGYTNGGLDGNTPTGTQDSFLIKYNSSGEKQYTKQLGAQGSGTYGNSVATDITGNVYVTGFTNGGLDGNTKIGYQDVFLTKFSSMGEKQYTKQLGVNFVINPEVTKVVFAEGMSVATDKSGNVYILGNLDAQGKDKSDGLDGNTMTGTQDFFLTKYSSSGEKQFTKQMAGVEGKQTQEWGVSTDANGNVFVAGDTDGLAGETLTGTNDFLLIKFNSSGVKQ